MREVRPHWQAEERTVSRSVGYKWTMVVRPLTSNFAKFRGVPRGKSVLVIMMQCDRGSASPTGYRI